MYAAKVKLRLTPPTALDTQRDEAAGELPEREETEDIESIAFSAGNPRVEHITGIVHLFKEVPQGSQALSPLPALPVSPLHLPDTTAWPQTSFCF